MVGVGLALGLLQGGLNTVQAIQSQKAMKQAAQNKAKAQQQLKNIKEFNAFKAVQVPTLGFELAQQSQAQATTQAVEATKAAGAEGVASLGNILAANNAAALDLAALAGEAKLKRDTMQAESEQGIQSRQAERDFAIGAYDLEKATTDYDAAWKAKNQAISGAVSALGGAALGAYEDSLLYKNKNQTTNFNVGDNPGFGQPGSGVMAYQGQPATQNQSWSYLTKP